MKKVKYDGSRWILFTENGGFFNPNDWVYFAGWQQEKIAALVKKTIPSPEANVLYEVPDNSVYASVHGPKCGPFWPDPNCYECGGKGVLGVVSDSAFNLGSTDEGNAEIEAIKEGRSNIHPELR
jgi:hypothetical protein